MSCQVSFLFIFKVLLFFNLIFLLLAFETEQNLRHLTKNRVTAPRQKRRPPTKFNNNQQAATAEPEANSKSVKKNSKSSINSNKSKFDAKKSAREKSVGV